MKREFYQSALARGLVSCAVLFALLISVKFDLYPIQPGLDPSWLEAIGFAQLHGYRFGDDISFTVGPLFNVLYSRFQGEYSSTIIIFKLIYASSLFAAIMLAFKPYWKLPILFFAGSLLFLFLMSGDVLGLIFILACYNCFARDDDLNNFFVILLLIGLSIICLAKFSNILPTFAILLLSDAGKYIRGKVPFITFAFLVTTLVVAASIGVYPPEILSYLKSGWLVASGYSEAMNVFSSPWEVILWLLFALYIALIVPFAGIKWKEVDRSAVCINWLAVACVLFMSFKHGFVRHDGHSVLAWTTLAFVYMFVLLGQQKRNTYVFMYSLIALVSIVVLTEVQSARLANWSSEAALQRFKSAKREASTIYRFVFSPSEWMKELVAADKSAKAAIVKETPFPTFRGTVDMMVNEQSSLVASGAMLTPRPSIQEHGAYSPELIMRNSKFFLGPRAPDVFLFGLGTIDDRHPAFSEGPQWLTFLSRYEPSSFLRNMLVLMKKDNASEADLTDETSASVSFGEKIIPPGKEGAYFVKIKLRKTLVGRLLTFAFKMPLVYLKTNYEDGTQTTYRLIPGMAEDGAILVPTIASESDFAQLYLGEKAVGDLKRPASFEILTNKMGALAYNEKITMSYSNIMLKNIVISESSKKFAEEAYVSNQMFKPIFKLNSENPPIFMRSSEGVFAHAPSSFRYNVNDTPSMKLQFGLRDGSWSSGGETDGACFVARAGERKLAERCLNPRQNVNDRGRQEMTVSIPPDVHEISLETTCLGSCAWDWTYWSKIDAMKR